MPLPPRPSTETPRGSWIGLLLAATMGLVIITALIFLTGGFLALVIVIGGGVFAFAAFHYLVWGWWLSKFLYEQEEKDREPDDQHS